MKSFYLFPEDLGDAPSFYECSYLRSSIIQESKQELWVVQISPGLPFRFSQTPESYQNTLIGLGMVNNSWSLERVGEFGFVVDVFLIKSISEVGEEVSAHNVARFGTATINDNPVKPSLRTNQ